MKIYTPLKAIRKKCLDCCTGNPNEVKLCPVESVKYCTLWPYRFGNRPTAEIKKIVDNIKVLEKKKRKVNPAALKALKKYREQKKRVKTS